MTNTTFFIIFIPILAILLLSINLILAPHNPYQEKDSVFECGFHSFLGQNRTQFSISFFIFGLLFLLFDLEILLVYPFSVSGYNNDIYGLSIMLVFFIALTLGFVFELGKNALTIDSKQTYSQVNSDVNKGTPQPQAYTTYGKPHQFASLPLQSAACYSFWERYTIHIPHIADMCIVKPIK
jgi:NADH-ubiquinone oxidoreductase chain 3